MSLSKHKKIYLDYAATTPVDPRVLRAMQPYFSEKFGNPGSLHSFGQETIAAVDASREAIAKAIGAEFREIVFTGSATEANNLALRGIVKESRSENPESNRSTRPRIIISAIEHESVLETARELEKAGIDVVYLPVNRHGVVDLKKLKENLTEDTVLVSIMYANNEIGTTQPIAEIAKIIRDFREERKKIGPYFHTDASQAFQFLDCNAEKLGVDIMTLSAHKIYGPKGAGVLYVKNPDQRIQNPEVRKKRKLLDSRFWILDSVLAGGGQEFGLRSGTENVPAIVGFAKAVGLISRSREAENKKIGVLRDRLWQGIQKIYPKAEMNGFGQLPNILNVFFPGWAAQDLLTRFDLQGVAVSSGSACRSRAMESSYIIEALGYTKERAKSSIRFSLGRPTSKSEIGAALKVLKGILK